MTGKVDIDVWSGGRGSDAFLTSDRFGRLRMSAGLIDMLACRDMPISLYVGYDKANKRIALGKPDVVKPTDSRPVMFDKQRHYAPVRGFMTKHQLPFEPVKYFYDGKYEGWMMFKREDYSSPDGRGS